MTTRINQIRQHAKDYALTAVKNGWWNTLDIYDIPTNPDHYDPPCHQADWKNLYDQFPNLTPEECLAWNYTWATTLWEEGWKFIRETTHHATWDTESTTGFYWLGPNISWCWRSTDNGLTWFWWPMYDDEEHPADGDLWESIHHIKLIGGPHNGKLIDK